MKFLVIGLLLPTFVLANISQCIKSKMYELGAASYKRNSQKLSELKNSATASCLNLRRGSASINSDRNIVRPVQAPTVREQRYQPSQPVQQDDGTFMDYSDDLCLSMFTQGQIDFMDLALTSSISERSTLISDETSDFVFYANDDERRVVFTDYMFYEDGANDGTMNSSVEIKLKNVSFEVANGTLSSSYYTIGNLPSGITETVTIIDNTTAQLTLSGTTTHNEEFDFDFSFSGSSSLFSESIPTANRTKRLQIDFIKEEPILYTDLVPNTSTGPTSHWYAKAKIKLRHMSKSIYLDYLDGEYQFETDEYVTVFLDDAGKTKTFEEGEEVIGGYEEIDPAVENEYYNLDIDQIQWDVNGEFYVGIVAGSCRQYYGWLRLQKDLNCDRIILKDYAVSTATNTPLKAGEVDGPVLSFETNILSEGEEFLVDLLPASNNERFATNVIGTTLLSNRYTVTDDDDMPDDFDESDIEIEILNANQAMVKASVNWSADITRGFTFNLDFSSSIFSGGIPTYNSIIEVYEPVDDLYWNIFDEGDKYISTTNHDEEYFSVYGENDFASTIGFIYTENTEENAYVFYNTVDAHTFEALCYPNSNEVMILGYGDDGGNGEYKKMDTGGRSNTYLHDDEVHLLESRLANYLGQDIYVLFRTYADCEIRYGTLNIFVSPDGSIEIKSVAFSNVPNEPVFTGAVFMTECLPVVESSFYNHIKLVQIGSDVFSQSSSEAESTYTDYTATQTFTVSIDENPAIRFKSKENGETYWYAWIDYNRDDLFMADELVVHGTSPDDEDEDDYNSSIYFDDDDPIGLYKIRIINSLQDDLEDILNGCTDFKYGEVEDYMINIESTCSDDIVYDAPIPSGTYAYDETITCQDYAYVGSQANVTLVAGDYILLTPQTVINYGATFEAYIDDCDASFSKKEAETAFIEEKSIEMNIYPNPSSSEFKVAYKIEEETPVSLEIYNSVGRVVQVIMNKEIHTAGSYTKYIDGSELMDGIYVVKIVTQDKQISQKLIKIQ